MNKNIRIEKENGRLEIYTPYNREFVDAIKMIGSARWDASKKCWTVTEDYLQDVRDILLDVYGCDDQEVTNTVTVRIEFEDDFEIRCCGVRIGNQRVAYATGRDSGATVGENAHMLEGKIGSGGSRAQWTTTVEKGSVFEVKDVMKPLLDKDMETGRWVVLDGQNNRQVIPAKVTILEEKIDKDALKKEKERLEARLAEINELLKEEPEENEEEAMLTTETAEYLGVDTDTIKDVEDIKEKLDSLYDVMIVAYDNAKKEVRDEIYAETGDEEVAYTTYFASSDKTFTLSDLMAEAHTAKKALGKMLRVIGDVEDCVISKAGE